MEGGKFSKVPRVEASRKISEFFRNSSSDKKKDAGVQVSVHAIFSVSFFSLFS